MTIREESICHHSEQAERIKNNSYAKCTYEITQHRQFFSDIRKTNNRISKLKYSSKEKLVWNNFKIIVFSLILSNDKEHLWELLLMMTKLWPNRQEPKIKTILEYGFFILVYGSFHTLCLIDLRTSIEYLNLLCFITAQFQSRNIKVFDIKNFRYWSGNPQSSDLSFILFAVRYQPTNQNLLSTHTHTHTHRYVCIYRYLLSYFLGRKCPYPSGYYAVLQYCCKWIRTPVDLFLSPSDFISLGNVWSHFIPPTFG